jgi:hypothetical protein
MPDVVEAPMLSAACSGTDCARTGAAIAAMARLTAIAMCRKMRVMAKKDV